MFTRKNAYRYDKPKKRKKKRKINFKSFIKHNVYYDIDGLDLFSKLKVLKEIL